MIASKGRSTRRYSLTRGPTASPSVSSLRRDLLTLVMLNEAFTEARAKDSDREQGVECKGAFWGLPCSFKGESGDLHLGWSLFRRVLALQYGLTPDTFNVRGVDTSVGCSR